MANRKLKIGFVLDTSLDPMDGVQQYVIGLGEWLRSQGHDVHYLVGQTESRQLTNIHSLSRNFSVTFNGNRTTIPLPTSRRKLRSFIAAHKFDVLHVQSPHHPLMSQRLILEASKDVVVVGTFHILPYGALARLGTRVLGYWLRPSLRRIDHMLAVSPTAAEFEEKMFKLPAAVLPNVVDYQRFNTAEPLAAYTDDTLTVLFLGRLVPRKGCQILLEAVKRLQTSPNIPKFRVVICGKGELESQLKQFVSDHKLEDFVEFTGFVSEADKPRYYSSADIAVFPSSGGESFGIVLLEAMASGRAAVLAGDNPGYRTVMSPNPDTLFDATDSVALATKLAELLRDEKKRQAIASWGQDYTKSFDVNAVGAQLVELYERLLAEKKMQ